MSKIQHDIPHHGLSDVERKEANAELMKARLASLRNMTDDQIIHAGLVRLRYAIMDYLDSGAFRKEFLFSEVLKSYVSILNQTRRQVAQDLGVHETKFSKYINDRENPGLGILYRIEEHSGGLLSASLLWRLVSRKLSDEIQHNTSERMKQSKKVKNKLHFGEV